MTEKKASLTHVALLFLKLGTIAFGGPAAHIAMMEEEVVRRRGWLSREEFVDLLSAVHLIPGPNSTELAIFIGYRKAGLAGLALAGICFILPAALIVSAIAWSYRKYGSLPEVRHLLYGIQPVIIAVVAQAVLSMGRAVIKTRLLAVLTAGSLLLAVAGLNPLLILVLIGGLSLMCHETRHTNGRNQKGLLPLLGLTAIGGVAGSVPFSAGSLFLFFLKVGSVLYGSGYVLLAFLRNDLVERWHWLTEQQLLDAVAVGQFTPGPVFTTATFIGYLLGGPWSACVATVGIFLPSFILILLCGSLVPKLRQSPMAGAFLDGVNGASLALMAEAAGQLGVVAMRDWATLGIGVAAFVILVRYRVNSAWLILGGALAGWGASLLLHS